MRKRNKKKTPSLMHKKDAVSHCTEAFWCPFSRLLDNLQMHSKRTGGATATIALFAFLSLTSPVHQAPSSPLSLASRSRPNFALGSRVAAFAGRRLLSSSRSRGGRRRTSCLLRLVYSPSICGTVRSIPSVCKEVSMKLFQKLVEENNAPLRASFPTP